MTCEGPCPNCEARHVGKPLSHDGCCIECGRTLPPDDWSGERREYARSVVRMLLRAHRYLDEANSRYKQFVADEIVEAALHLQSLGVPAERRPHGSQAQAEDVQEVR